MVVTGRIIRGSAVWVVGVLVNRVLNVFGTLISVGLDYTISYGVQHSPSLIFLYSAI